MDCDHPIDRNPFSTTGTRLENMKGKTVLNKPEKLGGFGPIRLPIYRPFRSIQQAE